MKNITIIIVNYNVTIEVVNLLKSIQLYLSKIPLKIIVVDNNSIDRSIAEQTTRFPDVKFIFLKENIGYSNANNYALKYSDSDYVLFLNPDTEIIEDFISPMTEFIEANKNIGACGPMLLYKNYSYQNSSGNKIGILFESMEAFMFINIYRKINKLFKRNMFASQKPFEVGWVSGACLLAKRSIIEKLEGFNPEYFLNYEDIDLCKRFKDNGYTNYYFPHLKCIHLNQKSQKLDYKRLVYSRYVSRLIYANLHYSAIEKIMVRFIHIIGLLLRLIFVNLLFSKIERQQRRNGYIKSLSLYLGFKNY